MTIQVIAENGTLQLHRQRFQRLLDSTTGPLRIASAYVTDTDLLSNVADREIQLLTSIAAHDVVAGATNLRSLRTLIESGVRCRTSTSSHKLHAKVYIFGDDVAVVTSAVRAQGARNIGEVRVDVNNAAIAVRVTASSPELQALAQSAFNAHGRYRLVASGHAYEFRFSSAGANQVKVDIARASGAEVHSQIVAGSSTRQALLKAAGVEKLSFTLFAPNTTTDPLEGSAMVRSATTV